MSLRVVIPLFDGITALDAIGPYEVLSRLPGAEVRFAAPEPGPQWTDRREVALVASHALADVDAADVLVVPGGFGTRPLLTDETWLDWVRRVHETTQWTTSVCTGSLLLGAAGLLEGLEATTHWQELETLRRFGATPTSRRVVRQGKIVTAAGVSSGIDVALSLASWIAGDDVAQAIQLSIEYDPHPPFDSGSLAKAPAEVVSLVRAAIEARAAR